MNNYDFIIAGAGCAGLSLVYHLERSALKGSKILLIDPEGEKIPNKTWCYWAEKPLAIQADYEKIVSWKKLRLSHNGLSFNKELGNLSYYHISSHEFYQGIHQLIQDSENITIIKDEVMQLHEASSSVQVQCKSGISYTASKLFDSRLDLNPSYTEGTLKQIFLGWKVKFSGNVFDPSAVTLMDINPNTSDLFSFFYILPYSASEALVEFTAYSKVGIEEAELAKSLQDYLTSLSATHSYEITFEEKGIIPMSTQLPVGSTTAGIIPIGTRAGWTKASTGYTFHRIQENCEQLIFSLINNQLITPTFRQMPRYKFYDNILLNIAHKWPEKLSGVFFELFKTSPPSQVLKFLNEKTSFFEELQLLSKLKFSIFLKSLWSYASR